MLRPNSTIVARTAVAAAALAVAGYTQHAITQGQQGVLQLVTMIVAALLFGAAVPLEVLPALSVEAQASNPDGYRLRRDGLSLITAACVLGLSLFFFWDNRQRGVAFFTWLAAMVWYVTSYTPSTQQLWARLLRTRAVRPSPVGIIAGAILIAVAIVNFWDLGTIPYGLWWDEANFGLYAQQILHHTVDFPLLTPLGDPALHSYLHVFEQAWFGGTEFATRILVALCGIAAVALVGCLAAVLWNRWIALTAMVVLGFMRWHIDFSRFGIQNMVFQVFELVVVVALVVGFKRRTPAWFALCGVMLGLSIHIYSPGFALTALVVLTLAYGVLFLKPRLSPSLAALVLIGFALAYLPLFEDGIQNPGLFNARVKQVSVFGPNNQYPPLQALQHNLRAHALMFNVSGDNNGRHNIPGQPQLDDVSAVLFLLGLALVVIRSRRPEYAFLLLWFLGMMVPGILSLDFEAPQSGRTVGAQPVVALFITLALVGAVSLAARLGEALVADMRARRAAAGALVAVVLAFVSISNVSAYFDAEVHNESVWEVWASDATFVGRGLAALPPSELTYVSPQFSGYPDLQYLAPGRSTGVALNPTRDLPFAASGPIAVFLSRDDHFYVPLLKSYYPHAQVTPLQGPELTTPPLAYEIRLSAADVAAARGLTFSFSGASGTRRVGGLVLPPSGATGTGTATWTGGIRIQQYGRATLSIHAPGRMSLQIDGHPVCSGDGAMTCTRTWSAGNHGFRLQAQSGTSGAWHLTWGWTGPTQPVFFNSPVMGYGLSAAYYPNASWHGPPALVQREPQVDYSYDNTPLPRPFSVQWHGFLHVPKSGTYGVSLDSVDDSWLAIDGRQVLHVGASQGAPQTTVLRAGWHRVSVRLRAVNPFTRIFLTWIPPGGTELIPVPTEDFRP